jgi:hypothetical protein
MRKGLCAMILCLLNANRGCYARDEGRPLEAGLQERASNQCIRLWLRAAVVSDARKVG